MSSRYTVRKARREELEHLPRIERSAAKRFSSVAALEFISRGDTLSVAELERLWLSERHPDSSCAGVWVILPSSESHGFTGTSGNNILGFLAAEVIDGTFLYLTELSIAYELQGKGAGSTILKAFISAARSLASSPLSIERTAPSMRSSLKGITLTTYPDLDFNGGFYKKYGFVEIEPEQLGPVHTEKLRKEKEELGLEVEGWRRSCMVLRLSSP